jgi:hypothetical protein
MQQTHRSFIAVVLAGTYEEHKKQDKDFLHGSKI